VLTRPEIESLTTSEQFVKIIKVKICKLVIKRAAAPLDPRACSAPRRLDGTESRSAERERDSTVADVLDRAASPLGGRVL